jgi:hypothetical protein
MIRHAIFQRCSPGRRLAQSVSALTISMIEPAFNALLMSLASRASLLEEREGDRSGCNSDAPGHNGNR